MKIKILIIISMLHTKNHDEKLKINLKNQTALYSVQWRL